MSAVAEMEIKERENLTREKQRSTRLGSMYAITAEERGTLRESVRHARAKAREVKRGDLKEVRKDNSKGDAKEDSKVGQRGRKRVRQDDAVWQQFGMSIRISRDLLEMW